VSSVFFN